MSTDHEHMRIPERLSCVIFDIDGTLTSTNALIFATFNHVAGKYLGRVFTPGEIIGLFGPPEEGAVEKVFGATMVPTVMDDMCTFYRAHHLSMAHLHDGMREALDALKDRGILLAVFTGKGRRTTSITLEVLGLASYFDMIVTGNDVTRHKPHGDGIRQILERLGVEPSETVMVGDSMADVNASREAGVVMAAVLWDAYDRERVLAAGTDLVFADGAAFVSWCRSHPGPSGHA
jgi:HAD superfamily hydrolase (TIGR01509 family)